MCDGSANDFAIQVEKINILGGSYQSDLLKQIPAENLPTQFGGTCSCSGGCELSDDGPWQDPAFLHHPTPAVTTETATVAITPVDAAPEATTA